MKRLSGNANTSTSFHIEKNGSILNDQELVNELNEFFTSVNADIPPLNLHNLPAFLPSIDQIPTIQPYQVRNKLLKLNIMKAPGPDNIPSKILKTFAYILAEPITDIFNVSLSSGVVPEIWKQANISSIPKESPPKILCDFRPISLTSTLSKVLEEFVVDWITEDICDKIDTKQFGSLKGGSTTKCLLDMLHNWLSNVDKQGNSLRVCLLDFSKAFDRININIEKVCRCLIPWICIFLSDRKQQVKLGETVSDWMSVNAGVPQGTKLGPILLLIMVNDLIPLKSDYWKYVDDMSISEVIPRNGVSNMQSELDHISSWATNNYMKLNTKKCEELRIRFLRDKPNLSQLYIDGAPIDTVDSAKVLGVSLQNDLKWKSHVDNITKKAAKRLYIIRVLKRNGLPVDDLITIFKTLIRSVLQYSCPVWHSSLPTYLSDKIEKIQ